MSDITLIDLQRAKNLTELRTNWRESVQNKGGVVEDNGISKVSNCFSIGCGKRGKLTNILLNMLNGTIDANKLPTVGRAIDKIEELYGEKS